MTEQCVFLQEKEFKTKIADGLLKEMKKYNDSNTDAKEKLDDLHKKVHSHCDYLYYKKLSYRRETARQLRMST